MSHTKKISWFVSLVLIFLLTACNGTAEIETIASKFNTFPGGTSIVGDTTNTDGLVWQRLNGNEFSEWGFLVDSVPVSSCVDVIIDYYGATDNYLALTEGGNCLNSRMIGISFPEPVKGVGLDFFGAELMYVMRVYDDNGDLLGSSTEQGNFEPNGVLPGIGFSSDAVNIARIEFGTYSEHVKAIVAIRELSYSR